MVGGLIYNGSLNSNKFNILIEEFVNSAKRKSICLKLYKNNQILMSTHNTEQINSLKKLDFIIFWDKDIVLGKYLESYNIRLFNRSDFIELCDNKAKTHLFFMNKSIPMPKTIFSPLSFNNLVIPKEFLSSVERELGYPFIVKECYGSFGQQVYLINNRQELDLKIQYLKNTPYICQEFIRESNGTDIRVQVVGKKILGAIKRKSLDDFRANLTLGGKIEPYNLNINETKLIEKILNEVSLDFAGIDILLGKDGPLLCEINSNAHFTNFKNSTNIDVASEIFNHIQNKVFA